MQAALRLNRKHRIDMDEWLRKLGPARFAVEQAARTVYSIMLHHVPKEMRTPMLELGASDGKYLPFLRSAGASELYAIELLPELCGDGVMCCPVELLDKVMPEASVNCVISIHTMEHVYDLPAALRQIQRVLRPGGYVCQATPGVPDKEPAHLIQPGDWLRLWEERGMEVIFHSLQTVFVATEILVMRERRGEA